MAQKFTPGDRVGILVGLQAVGGPFVGHYGTVQRQVEFWKGQPEYVVLVDGGGDLVYRPSLLVPVES